MHSFTSFPDLSTRIETKKAFFQREDQRPAPKWGLQLALVVAAGDRGPRRQVQQEEEDRALLQPPPSQRHQRHGGARLQCHPHYVPVHSPPDGAGAQPRGPGDLHGHPHQPAQDQHQGQQAHQEVQHGEFGGGLGIIRCTKKPPQSIFTFNCLLFILIVNN